MIESLKNLYTRDLNTLKSEIQAYKSEESIWKIEKNILNCAGNLCLHLVGNLQFFIGTQLGNTGYVRDREAEFSLKNVSRENLIKEIETTIEVVNSSLDLVSEEDLKQDYPLEPFGYTMTKEFFLIHLIAHLNYHLGQVNYHRRLIDTE